ncbi:hypothetical protein [Hoeflea sp. TYP-13]|uniref:hypothetical protein n=1 Tax=Hoeflea sp. TYP-13 TaxID=3230023 RepID=UPI0034C64231
MDKGQFRSSMLIWFGVLFTFLFFFPLMLTALLKVSACQGVGGACGALASVIGVYGKTPVILVIGFFIIRALHRRIRWLEISAGWTVLACLWLISAIPFLLAVRNYWGANFSLGLINVSMPGLLPFLLTLVVFLCFADYPVTDGLDVRRRTAWLAATIAAIHATMLLSAKIVSGFLVIPFFVRIFGAAGLAASSKLIILFNRLAGFAGFGISPLRLLWADLAVFAAALAIIVFRQARSDRTNTVLVEPAHDSRPRRSFGRRGET